MKNVLPLFLVLAAGVLHANPAPDPAGARIKAMMKDFLGDPGSSSAPEQARQILEYAEKTETHEVKVSPAYLPWMGGKDLPPESHLLMVAFIAGDLLEQMKKGASKPEPYAGMLTMLEAYEKLRLKNPDFRVDGIKKLVDLERAGQLKDYVDKIRAVNSGTSGAPALMP